MKTSTSSCRIVRMLPDAFAQFGARKDAARLPREHLQQYQLARRQLDFSPVAMHSMIYELKREITDAQGERRHFRHNRAQCAYACDQFRHGKWLGQTIHWGVNLAGNLRRRTYDEDAVRRGFP